MKRWPTVWLLLGQRRRRYANKKPTSGQRLMFAGYGSQPCIIKREKNSQNKVTPFGCRTIWVNLYTPVIRYKLYHYRGATNCVYIEIHVYKQLNILLLLSECTIKNNVCVLLWDMLDAIPELVLGIWSTTPWWYPSFWNLDYLKFIKPEYNIPWMPMYCVKLAICGGRFLGLIMFFTIVTRVTVLQKLNN